MRRQIVCDGTFEDVTSTSGIKKKKEKRRRGRGEGRVSGRLALSLFANDTQPNIFIASPN